MGNIWKNFKVGSKYYWERLRRILENPQVGHSENPLYGKIRSSYRDADSRFVFVLSAIIVFIFIYQLLVYVRDNDRVDLSQFEGVYLYVELGFHTLVIPSIVYFVIFLLFAHVVALFFRRAHDIGGYSLQWLKKGYVGYLGEVTVIAIILAVFAYAILVSGNKYKASFSLGDYLSFFIFIVSVLFSFIFLIKAFAEMIYFFKYPLVGLVYVIFCNSISWLFFEVFYGGELMMAIGRSATWSYVDPFVLRAQKLSNNNLIDTSNIRERIVENPASMLGWEGVDYSGALMHVKMFLFFASILIFAFFWRRSYKRSIVKSKESEGDSSICSDT